MICRSVSHHHAVCSRMTPSSIDSSPQPKTEQPFKNTSGAWKTGRLSGTWHSTRTSAADYRSPDLATMKITTIYLHGHTLATVSSAKYLGVTIQSNIGWEAHINNICAKGNRMLGFLRRNLKVASRHIKETAYKAIVRPILEYASGVWDPHTTKLIRKLEMIQRRAARFCLNRHHNTSSVDAMLTTLAWPTLQQRRKQARLTMLYKIRNGLVTGTYPQLVESAGRRRRTHDRTYLRIPCRTDYRKYCFLPRTICDWNSLPHDTVHSLSLGTFRSRGSKSQ